MRDIVLVAGPEGDAARKLSFILLACDGLVWAFVASVVLASL